jgi:Carboxypeptidase regulatory-like domain
MSPVVNWRNRFLLSAAAILVIANRLLPAQTTFANLRGTVRDASGATIANAAVTVRNAATRVTRDTRTDEAGTWTVFDLPPARYEVTIVASGFAVERRTDIELTVNAEEVLAFSLNPSSVESRVDVHAETPGVELENANLSGVDGPNVVRELPLNGRDWTQLALLEPGVSAIRTQDALNGSTSNRGSRGFGSAVTIDGARPGQNNYLLGGISQNDYTNGPPGNVLGLALGVDAIEEFSILSGC